jgi:hypothetical protein
LHSETRGRLKPGVVTKEGVQSMTPAPYLSVFAVDEISI